MYPNTIFKAILVIIVFIMFFGLLEMLANRLLRNDMTKDFFGKTSMLIGGSSMLISVFITKIIIEKRYSQKIRLNFRLTKKRIFYKIMLLLIFLIIGLITPLVNIASYQNADYQLENPFDTIYYLLSALLVAPLAEEILFRRIILAGLLSKYTYKKAIFISAILFALVHSTGFSPILTAFIFGLFSGYLYYKTNNLMAVILLHFFNNLIRTFCNYLHYKQGNSKISTVSDIYGEYSVYIISISLALFVLLLFERNTVSTLRSLSLKKQRH